MRKSLFSVLTFCLALSFVAPSANVNAGAKILSRDLDKIVNIQTDLGLIMMAIQGDITFMGAVDDPNPATNEAVAGLLAANEVIVDASVVRLATSLNKLGVPASVTATISTELTNFYDAAVNYSLAVNLENTAQVGPDQYVAATVLGQAAAELGQTLAFIAGDFAPLTTFTTVASLLTQEAQAWRLVLNAENAFGADPALPATETAAAAKIFLAIGELFRDLTKTLLQIETTSI